jgi:deoxyadenosine/deoxycytidine kinase
MPRIISIEGNIGSGKSTFLSYLKEYYRENTEVIFLREPVDIWEKVKDPVTNETMLEKFYADQPKYAFSFQIMAFISRLTLLKKTVRENPDAIIITERCLHTDKLIFAKMLYDMKNIEDVNYQIYCQIYDEFVDEYPLDKVIYIRTEPSICYERIHIRSRQGESSIPIEYLSQCHIYHENMMKELRDKNMNVLTLDGNVDIIKTNKVSIDEIDIHHLIES